MKSIATSLLILLSGSASVFAGCGSYSAPLETTDSPWEIRSALYGWGQALDGDVGIGRLNADLNLDFKDILEDLDIAAMGLVEIGRGRWSVLVDFNYAEISDSVTPFPRRPALSADFEQKQFLGNFLAIYQLIEKPEMSLDVMAGARVNWIDAELDAGPGFSKDDAWVDPIIGARFQAPLGGDFFFRALGDIGGFGAASDLTWQAMAGFGWQFNQSGAVLLGYRAISTDYDNGSFSYDVTAHGPVLGVEFKF